MKNGHVSSMLKLKMNNSRMKVLIAPLNWGLGHATRCIPIIQNYLNNGDEVILVADGAPAILLKNQFPELRLLELPSYPIRYSEGKGQVIAMIRNMPGILKGIVGEHRWLKKLINDEHFDFVISDNRFGMWNKKAHSVYITHQLMIRMPLALRWLEPISWLIHRFIINRYNECWIPDYKEIPNLSGALSHLYPLPSNAQFIGPLSRLEGTDIHSQPIGTLLLVSGPEPQRQLLEDALLAKRSAFKEPIVLVRGLPGTVHIPEINGMMVYNHLPDRELASFIKGAGEIICRSGYSTIMDLAALQSLHKARFIPTPGQTEQVYLARYHKKHRE